MELVEAEGQVQGSTPGSEFLGDKAEVWGTGLGDRRPEVFSLQRVTSCVGHMRELDFVTEAGLLNRNSRNARTSEEGLQD